MPFPVVGGGALRDVNFRFLDVTWSQFCVL